MRLAQSGRDADGLQHQHRSVVAQRQRPHRPRPVQLTLQSIFMGEAVKAGRRRMLRGRQHAQHGAAVAIRTPAPPSAEDAFAVTPQHLGTATISVSVELRG
jgi:hypothetical protein